MDASSFFGSGLSSISGESREDWLNRGGGSAGVLEGTGTGATEESSPIVCKYCCDCPVCVNGRFVEDGAEN